MIGLAANVDDDRTCADHRALADGDVAFTHWLISDALTHRKAGFGAGHARIEYRTDRWKRQE